MSKALVNLFNKLDACTAAKEWVETQPSRKAAWESCTRGDWMLWVLNRSVVAVDDPRYRLMGCDFAETALKYVPEGENRPAKAIRIARLFASGEATEAELSAAESAARSAAWSAAGSAAESAAWSAAWSAARSAAWSAAWSEQADIIRKYFPACPAIKVPK